MVTAKKRTGCFEQAAEFLPMFKDKLLAQSPQIREKTREIRLRAEQFMTLEFGCGADGRPDRLCLNTRVTSEDLKELLERFCDYSVHSYTKQIAQGFITLEGGHRAGFCGTAVLGDNNEVTAVRNITSINLRIAREFIGCSDMLYNLIPPEELKALLIIGKPMSAKTTVLRDFARNLSQDYKVTVIDERGEISADNFNHGPNTDVLVNFPKKTGFITALRALSPDFIVCDEIAHDGVSVAECLNSGVGLVMTAHCGSLEEALQSNALSGITEQVNYIALLGTGKNIGRLQGLWRKDIGEYGRNENSFSDCLHISRSGNRVLPFGGA